jgi:RNase H-fold protein (predicted Holliday junction resolvase)
MYTLGLDISSSKIGIALLKDDKIVISEVVKFKSNQSLEERAIKFETRMREIEQHYVVYDLFVEQPAMMFRGGKTTAYTMATLQRFNGMCCYALRKVFDITPMLVNPRSARSKLGIKTPRGVPNKEVKKCIIEHIEKRFNGQFRYNMTHKGNPQPGTDDRADALVIALAGPLLDNS